MENTDQAIANLLESIRSAGIEIGPNAFANLVIEASIRGWVALYASIAMLLIGLGLALIAYKYAKLWQASDKYDDDYAPATLVPGVAAVFLSVFGFGSILQQTMWVRILSPESAVTSWIINTLRGG